MPRQNCPESNDPRDIADFVDARLTTWSSAWWSTWTVSSGRCAPFLSGFPEGDPILHREYHKEQIELMKSRKALNRAVLEKLVSGGAWSALLADSGGVVDVDPVSHGRSTSKTTRRRPSPAF